MDANDITSGAAWREACERLGAMGEEILGEGWPDDEQGRVEGVRHLATQLACCHSAPPPGHFPVAWQAQS